MKNEIIGFDLRLTEKMKERDMKQADLCRLTGLSTSMVSHYCAGQRVPTLFVAVKIARALNTTVEYLVYGESMYENQFSAYSIAENEIPYSPAKSQAEHSNQSLIFLFRSLNQDGQAKVLSYIKDLISTGKYDN